MRIAYVVTVHKNPAQVGRLLRRLATDDAIFVLHVDRRAGDEIDAAMRRQVDGLQADFVARNRCFWGGFGHVRAAVKGLDHLLSHGVPFDYAVWLSGQDYPLRPATAIERFLAEAGGKSFLHHERLPTSFWRRGGFTRIEQWHLVSYRALHLPVPWRRKVPGGLAPYGGEGWWSFSRPVAEYVRDFDAANPSFVRFFEHVLHPAELFFHTIVMNSPFAETVVPDHLRYIDWSEDPGPVILRTGDLERLQASGKLFARKFDTDVDERVLDLIDEWADAQP
jgi:Core-2/I-Branching enzyme